MSVLPVANDPHEAVALRNAAEKPKRPKRKGPSLAQIHAKPLPLETHPLPAFHPSNPISLLRLAYTWLYQIYTQPTSHPAQPFSGYFSPETRSVHVIDLKHARALWEAGFFGKGTLSRSEPSWLQREKARLRKERYGANGVMAAEDFSNVRREERRLFKLERAMLERERIEKQRLAEEGKLDPAGEHGATTIATTVHDAEDQSLESETLVDGSLTNIMDGDLNDQISSKPPIDALDQSKPAALDSYHKLATTNGRLSDIDLLQPPDRSGAAAKPVPAVARVSELDEDDIDLEPDIDDQEHLQLTLEEAFFLVYGLGVLAVHPAANQDSPPMSPKSRPRDRSPAAELLAVFCQYSAFPPTPPLTTIAPDDQFLLNYVTYHHFRSLGWVVRSGTKFSVDYMLYNRGPAFTHAEFAVLIIPSYSDRYWNTPGGRSRRQVHEQKDWWWLHCVNRVQSQVKKTLVLCYVDVPSPYELDLGSGDTVDISKLLSSYRVREFVFRRWLANRSRD